MVNHAHNGAGDLDSNELGKLIVEANTLLSLLQLEKDREITQIRPNLT